MIKYDKPRTWWRVSKWSPRITPMEFVGETNRLLVFPSGRRTAKNCEYDQFYETKELAEAAIAERDAPAQRQAAALAALEGMPTEQLTPGCVAKLVEALERIQGYSSQPQIVAIATAALAAMKGV
jgi:hypothetical protein